MERSFELALQAVRDYVVGREPLQDTLRELARSVTVGLRADFTGLTLLRFDGSAGTAVSTAPEADVLDQAQYGADRGPCLDAFRAGTPFIVDDTRSEDRWPEFCAAAVGQGVLSSLSVPLILAGRGIGALNLYSTEVGHFTEGHAANGELYAAQAAVALANAQAYWEQATLAENLSRALESGRSSSRPRASSSPRPASAPTRPSTCCASSRRPRTASCATSPRASSRRRSAPTPPADPATPRGSGQPVPPSLRLTGARPT